MAEDNQEEGETEGYELFTGEEDAKGVVSNESILEPNDRPRGILSPTDREYLCGLKDYSHNQTELNRRQDIRERTIEGIRDFNLLWLLLDKPEWEKIIDAFEVEELNTAFSSMVAFMYLGLEQDDSRMNEVLERGLYQGANSDTSRRWSGDVNDVTVDIDIDYEPNIDQLYTRVQEGEADQLTPAEIGALVRAGRLSQEDLKKLKDDKPTYPSVSIGNPSMDSETDGE
jgi:hypothetical protein